MTTWIAPELDDAIYAALKEVVGVELAFEAAEAVVLVLLSRRDAFADMHVVPEPPRIFGWQPQIHADPSWSA